MLPAFLDPHAASVLLAKQGVVHTKNGTPIEGDITEGDEKVTITLKSGIQTIVERDNVKSIDYSGDVEQEYKNRLAKLDAKDAKGRVELAHWAFDNKRYDLARDASEKALEIDPNSAEATTFLDVIRNQQRIERNHPDHSGGTGGTGGTGAGGDHATIEPKGPDQKGTDEHKFLSASDINEIRQKELKENDAQVRFQFQNDVRRKFCTATNQDLATFNAKRQIDQAMAILSSDEKDLKKDVTVMTDPSAIADFKKLVQPLVLSHCATAGCHGGDKGGNFILFTTASPNDAVTYTNFYIMEKYAKKGEDAGGGNPIFAGGQRRMIDRTHPDASILVQYALPARIAEFDHPTVQGYDGFLRNTSDKPYKDITTWMTNLVVPEPDYKISYTPPGTPKEPTSKPATAPAPAPAKGK
jgi:tetratricopeptide (TPR) repeat protein